MEARAASTATTRERIVEAAQVRFMSDHYDDVTLRGIAANADVALGTVVNHFSNKDALFAAVADRLRGQVQSELDGVPVGDVTAAVRALMDRYERAGDATVRALAVEDRVAALRPLLADGREHMRVWVERTFAPALTGMTGKRRERMILTLVVACDALTWKQFRRDWGLTKDQTTAVVEELVEGIINQSTGRNQP